MKLCLIAYFRSVNVCTKYLFGARGTSMCILAKTLKKRRVSRKNSANMVSLVALSDVT